MGGKAGTAVTRTKQARAIWKGELELDGEVVGLKLYSAVENQRVHFRLLHEKDLAPVHQLMEEEGDGDAEVLEVAETRRAFPLDDGNLVLLSREELASVVPEKSRRIELVALVPREELVHLWYDRPYFLGPDGDDDAYVSLVTALMHTKRVALVRWAMRNKRYVGAVLPEEGRLVLCTLRHADEIVAMPRVEPSRKAAPTRKEMQLAEQLVDVLVGDFDPTLYQDEYRNRVLEYVEARARGEIVLFEPPEEKELPGNSLEASLEASLGKGAAHARPS